MCGICGVLEYGVSHPKIDERTLTSMTDAIAHRGPDDSGTFVSREGNLGFGFRRLAIVDLSPAGHQPMSTPDGNVTIVFNGEIYNHAVLRKTLESKGYRYRSRSDTETILYCYQEYGLDFVHKLLGMFAIAIWDGSKQRLVLARDRIGIKPLYYAVRDGRFVFGSEIKAMLKHPGVPKEFNEAALEHYLTFLIPPAPLTLFKGVHKLEPGHRMIVTATGNVTNEPYWDPLPAGDQPTIDFDGSPIARSAIADLAPRQSEAEVIDTIRTLLRQSIKDRMMSDVPFGVFLSGGIDSSTNVALMAELMDRPVDTFSVGFRDLEKYNEMGYARQIATQFKTNHHEVIIDQKDAFDFLPKLVWHQDEPLADPVCIPLYFVSKLARDNGTIVVQVGEGSDEQFAGYSWMKRELAFYSSLWRTFGLLPGFLRKAVYAIAGPALRKRGSHLMLDYVRKGAEDNELFWGGAINFTEEHRRTLMARRINGSGPHEFAHRWHKEALQRLPKADYLQRMIWLEFRQRLPELLLMRVDKIAMATSIEARVPFLDHRMVEYSMQLPIGLKLRDGVTKYILKKAVEGIIPNEIIYRPKQGFAAPMNEWIRDPWYPFVRDLFERSALVRQGYFNRTYLDSILSGHRAGRRDAGQLIWNLVNLLVWHEVWFERPSV